MLRYVLDTHVIVAGLRSRLGASARLLAEAGLQYRPVLSTAMLLEYQAVVRRPALGIRLGIAAIEDILDYLCAIGELQEIFFLWRPSLQDPCDDFVLELAVASRCDAIVTHNLKDFGPAARFGIPVLTPALALKRLEPSI